MLVYAIFPLLLVDPRSTGEGGVLLIPVSGFADNLLIALSTSFVLWLSLAIQRPSCETPSDPPLLPFLFPYPNVYLSVPCLNWYLLVGYLQILLCIYSSSSYRLQKDLLLYSSIFHLLSPQLGKKTALIPL